MTKGLSTWNTSLSNMALPSIQFLNMFADIWMNVHYVTHVSAHEGSVQYLAQFHKL